MSEDTERTEAPAAAPGPPAQAPAAAPGPAAQRTARQRRPTGAPPPLPHPITVSTTAWLLLAVVVLAGAFLVSELTPWRRADDQIGTFLPGSHTSTARRLSTIVSLPRVPRIQREIG